VDGGIENFDCGPDPHHGSRSPLTTTHPAEKTDQPGHDEQRIKDQKSSLRQARGTGVEEPHRRKHLIEFEDELLTRVQSLQQDEHQKSHFKFGTNFHGADTTELLNMTHLRPILPQQARFWIAVMD
jgi:hypothetical protein